MKRPAADAPIPQYMMGFIVALILIIGAAGVLTVVSNDVTPPPVRDVKVRVVR